MVRKYIHLLNKSFKQGALVFWLLGLPLALSGQDISYTQFYATPLLLNPAATGLTEQYRLAAAYRRQWAAIPNGFNSNYASFDYNLAKQNSGMGLLLQSDRFGMLDFASTRVAGSYAYSLRVSEKWYTRLGFQAGYTIRQQGIGSLLFEDGILAGGATQEVFGDGAFGFGDLGIGGMLYSERLWIGYSGMNLNRPRPNFNGMEQQIGIRHHLHGGAFIPMGQGRNAGRWGVAPAFLYRAQNSFQQLDVGTNLLLYPLKIGAWYRGLPVASEPIEGIAVNESMAILVGIETKWGLAVGYSYDHALSDLRRISGPSHEISIVYTPAPTLSFRKRNLNRMQIPCPAFY